MWEPLPKCTNATWRPSGETEGSVENDGEAVAVVSGCRPLPSLNIESMRKVLGVEGSFVTQKIRPFAWVAVGIDAAALGADSF
jgi:hypothetical protein